MGRPPRGRSARRGSPGGGGDGCSTAGTAGGGALRATPAGTTASTRSAVGTASTTAARSAAGTARAPSACRHGEGEGPVRGRHGEHDGDARSAVTTPAGSNSCAPPRMPAGWPVGAAGAPVAGRTATRRPAGRLPPAPGRHAPTRAAPGRRQRTRSRRRGRSAAGTTSGRPTTADWWVRPGAYVHATAVVTDRQHRRGVSPRRPPADPTRPGSTPGPRPGRAERVSAGRAVPRTRRTPVESPPPAPSAPAARHRRYRPRRRDSVAGSGRHGWGTAAGGEAAHHRGLDAAVQRSAKSRFTTRKPSTASGPDQPGKPMPQCPAEPQHGHHHQHVHQIVGERDLTEPDHGPGPPRRPAALTSARAAAGITTMYAADQQRRPTARPGSSAATTQATTKSALATGRPGPRQRPRRQFRRRDAQPELQRPHQREDLGEPPAVRLRQQLLRRPEREDQQRHRRPPAPRAGRHGRRITGSTSGRQR